VQDAPGKERAQNCSRKYAPAAAHALPDKEHRGNQQSTSERGQRKMRTRREQQPAKLEVSQLPQGLGCKTALKGAQFDQRVSGEKQNENGPNPPTQYQGVMGVLQNAAQLASSSSHKR
jgi:hypothetical protein